MHLYAAVSVRYSMLFHFLHFSFHLQTNDKILDASGITLTSNVESKKYSAQSENLGHDRTDTILFLFLVNRFNVLTS